MAEGLLKSMWPGNMNPQPVISSAGTHAIDGLPAEPYAIRVAGEYGVDIRSHRSRAINVVLIKRADLILAMEQQHVDFIRNAGGSGAGRVELIGGLDATVVRGEIPDPYGGSADMYRECARMIHRCLESVITRMVGDFPEKKPPDSICR